MQMMRRATELCYIIKLILIFLNAIKSWTFKNVYIKINLHRREFINFYVAWFSFFILKPVKFCSLEKVTIINVTS